MLAESLYIKVMTSTVYFKDEKLQPFVYMHQNGAAYDDAVKTAKCIMLGGIGCLDPALFSFIEVECRNRKCMVDNDGRVIDIPKASRVE